MPSLLLAELLRICYRAQLRGRDRCAEPLRAADQLSVEPTAMTEMVSLPRKVTSDELLSLRESCWAPRLRSVSLVTEYQVKEAHAAQALTVLARLYQRMMDISSAKAQQLLRRWPAVQVILW